MVLRNVAMDELPKRFQKILDIKKDPFRFSERRTFNRLLYKNRNQHRHGFYFRRLEHVRRLLRKVDNHLVWESLRNSLGKSETSATGKRRQTFLPLSSITLGDLESVEELLTTLSTAVKTASAKVTKELISRQHFLPFAVAVIAALSRIYVIEQVLLAEIRGSVVETKLLLNGDDENLPSVQGRMPVDHGVEEDLGQEIPLPPSLGHPVQTLNAPESTKHESTQSPLPSFEGLEKASVAVVKELSEKKAQEISLYDILAEHEATVASTGTAGELLRAQGGHSIHAISAKIDINESKRFAANNNEKRPETQAQALAVSRNKAYDKPNSNPRSGRCTLNETFSREDDITSGHPVAKNKDTADQASSCDSEDLDDIFDALDD